MNFIEKEKLIKADIVSIENRVRHAFNQGYDLGFNDGKKAKPQDIDYKAQYERLSKKAEIVISQLRADRDRLMSLRGMTREEKIICKHFLDDADKTHSCNEYKLLMALLEQEPKSEWQKDHEILKAYSDGANEVIDKIRAEIMSLTNGDTPERIWNVDVLKIIDKYKEESEG